ncbi:T9SS type A sorting domain-containing protein [Aurantibacillus circumpalustris]|uniref:T9SS type A sorting domain-containing protein n=1 Tax=Aurantibacillus circumpalustris TaxID=3036359 RepID=UPI00295A9E5E|nr:T9SS type A sorting domain-containing protein [Aurantibacillus circumpalustris]
MSQRITKVLALIALSGLTGLLNAQTMKWKPAGPIYNAGRARNIIVDQSDSKVLYVGSASSGIFKSKNGGIKWYPLNDQAVVRNISYLAQGSDGTIYVGTGEGFLRPGQKAKAQVGTGLYKLNQADSSLTLLVSSSVVGTEINRVACSPSNANYVALATNLGIFVSSNGGGAFTQVSLPQAPSGSGVSGQDVKFNSNGILYCSIGSYAGTTSSLSISKVYKSTDATASTFTNITPTSSLIDANYGRIELAIAPSNQDVIYASCANNYVVPSSATLKGLFVSYDAGSTWGLILQGSSQLDPLSNGGTIASGDYAHVIMVDPNNKDILFFGGYSFYVFFKTGGTNLSPVGNWVNASQSFFANNQSYLHENIHDIKVIPGAPNSKYYFVTDAGVYRSIDLSFANQNSFPSYQPFYKGMVTGQFNSVSIERFPIGKNVGNDTAGVKVTPYSGFIGGTGGNGLNYYSGLDTIVSKELSYLDADVYNSEYSKILPNAAFASRGDGRVYRSTNIKTSPPTALNSNKYTGVLSKISPTSETFTNYIGSTSGTAFRLWEYYGQTISPSSSVALVAPDSVVFYNDTIRYQASMSGVTTGLAELTTKTTFTFSTSRPNQYALIDSIVVRTGTVQLPITGTYANLQTPFLESDSRTIYARAIDKSFSSITTTTVMPCITVGASTVPVNFTLNPSTLIDNISVTFTAPPFATKTITQYPATATGTSIVVPDAATYYRVFATIFYKYQLNDVVSVVDDNISTKTTTYKLPLTKTTNWRYGSFPARTIASTSALSVTSPTYVLMNNSKLLSGDTVKQSSPTFTVKPYSTTSYTIHALGDYTLKAIPIVYKLSTDPLTYTLTAPINTNVTSPDYTLNPGAITQSANPEFTVMPLSPSQTTYTILSGTGSNSMSTTFTIGAPILSINPSANTQSLSSSNSFSLTVNPTVTTTYTLSHASGTVSSLVTTSSLQTSTISIGSSTYIVNPTNDIGIDVTDIKVNVKGLYTYTVLSLSSNTLAGRDTSKVYKTTGVNPNLSIVTTTVVTFGDVPLNPNNPTKKAPMIASARLAMILRHPGVTGGADAIVVSKNPLALNDPLSFVRVSQSGAYSDDASGNPTTNVVSYSDKPTTLEWSKSGTEIYFATVPSTTAAPQIYKLYRVSHITTIMDLTPSSYSGKFYTDIFTYTNSAVGYSTNPNPVSPYRTTLIGSFDKPITSISVSNDGKNLAVTFNGASTGTTGTVMYNKNDASKSNQTNIVWEDKQGSLANAVTYCSMMEKGNDKIVFVGTDNGMFYTSDITSGSWSSVNSSSTDQLPKVQIFDIKQQILNPGDCYNSGQIYVATNGRGVWTTGTYFTAYAVGVEEKQKPIAGKNLSLYPNPTNGNVNIAFSGVEGETAILQVMDISGRVVISEDLGKMTGGDFNHQFETNTLNAGVYIVNIQSNAKVKRVTKLIVTK